MNLAVRQEKKSLICAGYYPHAGKVYFISKLKIKILLVLKNTILCSRDWSGPRVIIVICFTQPLLLKEARAGRRSVHGWDGDGADDHAAAGEDTARRVRVQMDGGAPGRYSLPFHPGVHVTAASQTAP